MLNICWTLTFNRRLVEGIWSDEDIKDPLGMMVDLLSKSPDKALVQQWGLWLTARNADLGLKVSLLCLPHPS